MHSYRCSFVVPLLHTGIKHMFALVEFMWHFVTVTGFSKSGKNFVVVQCIFLAEIFLALLTLFF